MKNTKFTLIIIQIILSSFFNPLFSYTKKPQLSPIDIISKNIVSDNSFRKQVFNQIAGFNGKTYTKQINYYIHNLNGYNNFKLLNNDFAYSISSDAEKFIEDIFTKLDRYIDLDFQRVYSRSEATIEIYRTNSNSYNDTGKPINFNPAKKNGVSDHLPMVAKFEIIN